MTLFLYEESGRMPSTMDLKFELLVEQIWQTARGAFKFL